MTQILGDIDAVYPLTKKSTVILDVTIIALDDTAIKVIPLHCELINLIVHDSNDQLHTKLGL